MSAAEIQLRGVNVRAGDRQILSDVSIDLPQRSFVAIVGPVGGGKSTLLKYLAGALPAEIYETEAAFARFRGRDPDDGNRPILVAQRVREQVTEDTSRRVMVNRLREVAHAVHDSDRMLCIDEPTAGLMREDAAEFMSLLRVRADRASVLMVSHNLIDVREHCDSVLLLGAGRCLEHLRTAEFFSAPTGTHAERFVRTGGLDVARVDTPQSQLSVEHRTQPGGYNTDAGVLGPDGQTWIIDGRLALRQVATDDAGIPLDLADLPEGCILVTAGAEDAVIFDRHGGRQSISWPEAAGRPDLGMESVLDICNRLDSILSDGRNALINTGRNPQATAAMLGAFLVHRGFAPDAATEIARNKLPDQSFCMQLEQFFWDVDLELAMRC